MGTLQLLTIIVNTFYDAQIQLMDSIAAKALSRMGARDGAMLEVGDFAFGFGQCPVRPLLHYSSRIATDMQMSQEIPFLVDINHRVRDTLESLRRQFNPPLLLPVLFV